MSSGSAFKDFGEECKKLPDIPIRTNETKVGGRASRKAASEIAKLAGDRFPETKRYAQEIFNYAIAHTTPPNAGLRTVKDNLISTYKKFGPAVLAQTAKFMVEHLNGDAYDDNAVHSVALCFKEGKSELLDRTVSFMYRNGDGWSTWDIGPLTKYIELRGVDELEKGMRLAIPAEPEPENGVLPQYWRPEVETTRRQKTFAFLTGRLGFAKLENLTLKLKEEGLAHNDVSELAHSCAYSSNQDREIRRVFESISLVKEAGLNHSTPRSLNSSFRQKSLATAVYGTLKSNDASHKEVKTILQLMVDKGVEWISGQDLSIAARYYRRPSHRGFVLDAFEKKMPHLLTYGNIYEGLTIGIHGYVENGAEATDLALAKAASKDAHARTQELMSEKYPKLGIFGQDREFVQELSKNPIFVHKSLTLRKAEAKTQLGMVDQATRIFGRDSLKSVTRYSEKGMEPEYALALLRTRNPVRLANALKGVPTDSRLSAIRVINHHGLKALQQSVEILDTNKLDPKLFMRPVAAALARKGKDFIPIRPQAFSKPLTPKHEHQLQFFLSQPPAWQRSMARAVKMYRSFYAATYIRILYN